MKKKYDFPVNRQSAVFLQKRTVFLFGTVWLPVNLLIFSYYIPPLRRTFLMLAAVFTIFILIQVFVENRTASWSWPAVICDVLMWPLLSLGLLWAAHLHQFSLLPFLLLFLAEVLLFAGVLVFLFRSRIFKK